MPAPRSTLKATSITIASDVLRDPADVFDIGDGYSSDPGDMVAAMREALERIAAARPVWHSDAECRKHPDVNFFSVSKPAISKAIQVCGRCQCRTECLDWAIEIGDEAAVLGGTDPAARKRMIRDRRAP
jgi:hypothetical protein